MSGAQDIRDALNVESANPIGEKPTLELDVRGAQELARYASLELLRITGVAGQIEDAIMLHQYRLMINQNHAKINQLYNAARVLGFTTSFVSGGSLAYGFYIEW